MTAIALKELLDGRINNLSGRQAHTALLWLSMRTINERSKPLYELLKEAIDTATTYHPDYQVKSF